MISGIFFIISFGASVIGAICGIGGGVIIKPVMDALGVMEVPVISFLSGCTVLSMTTYSVIKGKISGEAHIEKSIGLPLAIGAALGGVIGKWSFDYIKEASADVNMVGAVQAVCLLIVTLGTLIYTLNKSRIKTYNMENKVACTAIGIFLGLLSSFLGIGGGPINLVVLFFFFSMGIKAAAANSLYIILFSQIASLLSSIITGSVPSFHIGILIVMVAGGIIGGICGRALNKKIDEEKVNKLFVGLMIGMIIINIYNIYKFL